MAQGRQRGGALRTAYLLLAVAGFVIPYVVILPWFAAHRADWGLFFALPFASRPAAMFSLDVLLSAAVFLIWADVEARRLGMRARWQPLACIVLAGLCFALPLFLARREGALARPAR